MIVDVHSHAWKYPQHFSEDFIEQAKQARAGVEVDLTVRYDEYLETVPKEEEVHTIVFGGKAKLSGIWVDDEYVADYAKQKPGSITGFLSLDPTVDGWQDEMRNGHQKLGLKGIKLLPMYAGFKPDDTKLDELWQYASDHQLPVLLHAGTTFISQAPLECTLPRHLDPVATRFPEVKIIMAHLGHPYEGEAIVVARKHRNVFTDISALHYRPHQLYHSLMLVQEYGIWDKVLFGTDYPFTTINETITGLHRLNQNFAPSAAARLNDDEIEKMIHRDSLSLLGLKS